MPAPQAPDRPSAPLSHLTVFEIGTSIAAPYACKIMAEMGATIVKVETPGGGDPARGWGPPFAGADAVVFHLFNRGKRSVTVDLRAEGERARLRRLIRARADVVIQNLRPGAAARFGIGAAALTAENPRLIYCNLGAFGGVGPMRDLPGYDPLIQAFSGIIGLTGEADRPPSRVGVAMIDLGTGMWSAIGILAALARRERTGRGAVVDTSLFETGLAYMSVPISEYLAAGKIAARSGLRGPMVVPNQGYRARDGLIMLTAASDAVFARLCRVLGRPELAADPRFADNEARVRNADALQAALEAALAGASRAEWTERLNRAGVPNAALQNVAEAVDHPQTRALGMLQQADDGLTLMGLPVRFDGTRPAPSAPAPAPGADGQLLLDLAPPA